MKYFFILLLSATFGLASGQVLSKKQDYFIQFNGDKLSKKVDMADVLGHSFLKTKWPI